MANQPVKKISSVSDLRKYASQTSVRLVLGFILVLLMVGLGLVGWLYGRNAAILGFFCLLGAGIPIGLIAIFILGLDFFVKKSSK